MNQSKDLSYPETHPWLAFEQTDLTRPGPGLWMLLGEAASKCYQIVRSPLRPAIAAELHRIFLAKGVHGTTAIEGNTLSEDDVRRSLDDELRLPPSKDYLKREIDNIVEICNQLGHEIEKGAVPLVGVERLLSFNATVLKGLDLEEGVVPGEFRIHRVEVGGYRPPAPQECELLLSRMCSWLGNPILPEGFQNREVADAIVRSILAHLYVAWIHPFGDGNGRTARLLEFQILLSAGLPAPVCHLLSNHYNQTRTEYYRQLDGARQQGGVCAFLEYALQGIVDGQFDAIQSIWYQQLDVTWRSHIYQQLKNIRNAPGDRVRRLAFGFPAFGSDPVPFEKVPELTPKIARDYAKVSSRTLRRDIATLIERGILVESDGGYRANVASILQWIPRNKIPWNRIRREGGDLRA